MQFFLCRNSIENRIFYKGYFFYVRRIVLTKKNEKKKVDIINIEQCRCKCWVCNNDIALTRCQNKSYFAHFYCQVCSTRGFVHQETYGLFTVLDFDGVSAKVDVVEVQNFETIQIEKYADCPICLDKTLRIKKCMKKLRSGKVGRPRKVIGNRYFCNCKPCKFTSYVSKGLGKNIYISRGT